ncbi:MAG: N-acetylmuramoyl-L-alanine amidase [Alphaproteobacteria bacterium]|nr:N-acetylmuramoyl-L-alanine amidase [Alphaproteobacteria bacterium]
MHYLISRSGKIYQLVREAQAAWHVGGGEWNGRPEVDDFSIGVMLVNLRAGVSFAEDRYEISAFVRNATDRNYLLDAGNTGGAFGIPTFIPAEPRFYGAQLTGRF